MSKHTPGEWRVILDKFQNPVICAVSGNRKVRVARAFMNRKEVDDNAALIAAAPEMLEALNNLVELAGVSMKEAGKGGADYDIDAELSAAISAIAKAEGVKNG